MIDSVWVRMSRERQDKIDRILYINPELDLDDFQINLLNYCKSRMVTISNTLDYCLHQSAKGEYMPWDQPLN